MFHHHFFPFLPGVLGWTIIIVCLVPYFLPTIIAMMRNSPNAGGIFAVNFLLGWTFIGWVACLIWSLAETRTTVIVNNAPSQNYPPSPNYPPPPSYPQPPIYPARQTDPTLRRTNLSGSHPTGAQDKIDQLRQLKQLLDEGILTEEEFNKQKAAILG
jgi:hypothetical protein